MRRVPAGRAMKSRSITDVDDRSALDPWEPTALI